MTTDQISLHLKRLYKASSPSLQWLYWNNAGAQRVFRQCAEISATHSELQTLALDVFAETEKQRLKEIERQLIDPTKIICTHEH